MFIDGTPGYKATIIIRNAQDKYTIVDKSYGDQQGYYMFYEVSPGTYYVNTVCDKGYSSDPDAIVTVSGGEEVVVETLTTYKDIPISLGKTKTARLPGCSYCRKTVVQGPRPKFSWGKVPNAAYYELEVWSTYTDEHPDMR